MMTLRQTAFEGKPLPCRIIDAHTHIGPYYLRGWQQKYDRTTLPALMELLDRVGIDTIVTAPHLMIQGNLMAEANASAAQAAQEYPGRVYGYISVVPACGMEEVKQELEKYRVHPAFVGLKFLGGYHGLLDQKEFQYALDFADEMGCVVLAHTWNNNPPLFQFGEAVKHRHKLQLIIAHQGGGSAIQSDACAALMREYENISMELCGSLENTYSVDDLAAMVGVERLIFGTDCINLDARYDFGRVAFSILTDEEKKKVFADNFIKLMQNSQMARITA